MFCCCKLFSCSYLACFGCTQIMTSVFYRSVWFSQVTALVRWVPGHSATNCWEWTVSRSPQPWRTCSMLNGLRHFNFKQIEIIPLWEYFKCYNWSNITKISSSLSIKSKPTDWSWNLGNHWTDCYTNYWHTASIKVECSLINNFFLIQSKPHETSFF